eukprot:gnl/Carplike_NY0171/28646_a58721_49.p1 GENE.gnl/Carplike_NY0171/28646_a58721_49~~gnl/Carplike_NY0171/28646_a58721_49.p1  ORF type:complete len:110 (-),score=16.67 gnl/Carplike_NY0171/28646_a58721_49:114-443(-)
MYKLPLAGAQVLPIIVNRSAWKKLPEDLQVVVRKATERHAAEQLRLSRQWESEAVAEMEAKGLLWSPEPSEADRAAWKEAGAGLWEEYASQDKFSKQLIDILRDSQASK